MMYNIRSLGSLTLWFLIIIFFFVRLIYSLRESDTHLQQLYKCYIIFVNGKYFYSDQLTVFLWNILHFQMIYLYSSSVCSKGFSLKHNLKTNMRIYTDETPFKCEIGNTKFNTNTHL
jgi:uncharacterized Zn-finger protein